MANTNSYDMLHVNGWFKRHHGRYKKTGELPEEGLDLGGGLKIKPQDEVYGKGSAEWKSTDAKETLFNSSCRINPF